jgi:2,4-dihydroxyhept-2-ene-1,7-dioic acid aldolase
MKNGRSVDNSEARGILAEQDAVSFVMIETLEALDNLDEIAAVPGLDVMLIGSMDITMELGILAAWDHPSYQSALLEVSQAASRHGKLWGISGLFSRPDIWTHAMQNLGARFIVGALDRGLLSRAATANVTALQSAMLEGVKQSCG